MASLIENFYDKPEKCTDITNKPITITGKDGRKYICTIDKTFFGKTRVSINFCIKKTIPKSTNIHKQLTEIVNNYITMANL